MTPTWIGDFLVEATNEKELRQLEKEIFQHHTYYFEGTTDRPRILDLGAHLGLTTLYFKKLYPLSQITAVEPNPAIASLLRKNLIANHFEDVVVVEAAVAPRSGKRQLFIDSDPEAWDSTASFTRGAWNRSQEGQRPITVPTVTLAELIDGIVVDVMKMDIEGAESEVLLAAGEELRYLQRLMMEFHPTPDNDLFAIAAHLELFGLFPTEPIQMPRSGRNILQMIEFVR